MIYLYQYQYIFHKLRRLIYDELKFEHNFTNENYNQDRH